MQRGISAVGSAQHWQCWGQGFESPMLHQKKALAEASAFLVKFAYGEWNMASPCEIASLWNICFANVRGEFYFTSTEGRYFTISARKLFHIRREPNISLKNSPPQVADDIQGFHLDLSLNVWYRFLNPLRFLYPFRCLTNLGRMIPPRRAIDACARWKFHCKHLASFDLLVSLQTKFEKYSKNHLHSKEKYAIIQQLHPSQRIRRSTQVVEEAWLEIS